MSEDVRRFGEAVRRRRQGLGLDIPDLAARAKITPNYLGDVERGGGSRGPSLEVALKIAGAFGIGLGDLLGCSKGLSAGGIEAGRLYDALPIRLKMPLMQTLHTMVKCCSERTRRRS